MELPIKALSIQAMMEQMVTNLFMFLEMRESILYWASNKDLKYENICLC